jgi:S1-C subfamily serine protease
LILKVRPNSPAAAAGLQGTRRDQTGNILLGDVIVGVDGQAITRSAELLTALERLQVGDKVTVTILRNNQRQDVKVTLQTASS